MDVNRVEKAIFQKTDKTTSANFDWLFARDKMQQISLPTTSSAGTAPAIQSNPFTAPVLSTITNNLHPRRRRPKQIQVSQIANAPIPIQQSQETQMPQMQ